jgi:biopolymer transport protein ExbD
MELVQKPHRSLKLFRGIDTTAFASILVVLVFVVWIAQAASYNPHHGVSADLPNVSRPIPMPGAARDDAMKVTILRDGQVYFGTDRVWSGDLAQKIQDRLKDREVERKVYITADARVGWGTVKAVLEQVRSAGILRVAFMANQRRLTNLTR